MRTPLGPMQCEQASPSYRRIMAQAIPSTLGPPFHSRHPLRLSTTPCF